MSETADNRLMEDVRDGKVEKLAILFERYQVMLFNFFLRLTGNRNVSEDLVQDVFFRILKYRGTYKGDGKFSLWMYQIARNAHVDYLRKHKPELSLDGQYAETPSLEPEPPQQIGQEQEIALIKEALTRLPLRKREMLILSRYQDMKYGEIAELFGCTVGTVKSYIHRAIKELGQIYLNLQGGTSP